MINRGTEPSDNVGGSVQDVASLSREELEAEVLWLREQQIQSAAFGRPIRSTPAGHDALLSAIEKTRMPMILTDPNRADDPIIFANRAFQDLSGYDADELVGRNCRFLQGPDTDPNDVQRIREALHDRRDIALDLLNYRRDGTQFLNELYISPVFGPDGGVLYHFGSQLDVTGFRKDRDRLAAVERRQRAVFASAVGVAIIATDRDGRVTDWNTGAEHVFGWTTDEMRGHSADRFFTPEDRAAGRVATEMRLSLAEGRASDERWHLRKDGSRFWASGEMMPLRDLDGAQLGFLKIVHDRTSEHLAGRALEDAEARLRRAQEAGGVGLFTVDIPGGTLRPTPEFCRLYGLPVRDSYPATAFEALVIPEDAHLVSTAASRKLGDAPPDVEYRIRRADTGALCWIARKGEIERDEGGRPLRFSGASRDVTLQRAAQEALARSEAHWRGLFERLSEGFIVGEVIRDGARAIRDWRYIDVNAAWGELVSIDPATAIDRTIREVFPGIEDAWVHEFADVVETGQPITFVRQVGTLARWYEGRAFPLQADRFGVIFLEVTERVQAEARRDGLLEFGQRLRADIAADAVAMAGSAIVGRVLGAGRVGYGTVGPDGEMFAVDEDWTAPGFPSLAGRYRMDDYGAYAEDLRQGRTVIIPDVREDPRTEVSAANLEAVSARALINLPIVEKGRTVAVLYVNDDRPRVWSEPEVAFVRQITELIRQAAERRRAEERQDLLNHELSHRLKNLMAMILSIAHQTLRSVADRGPVEAFQKRIQALASAHDLLLRKNWAAADLRAVCGEVLRTAAGAERFSLDGPEVSLGPGAALSTSLLLHELAVNSAKYGSLSTDAGRVEMRWGIEGGDGGPDLVLRWRERGGPPVEPPTRRGFGSRLIRTGLVGTGGVELTYPPEGVVAVMRAPMAEVQRS